MADAAAATADVQPGTPPPSEHIRSPLAKHAQPKAPARVTAKKRAGAAAAGSAAVAAAKPRVTRRELKKLTEMDLEEKDAGASSSSASTAAATPAPMPATAAVAMRPFGEDAASTEITPSSLHDDFVNLMKAQGLEKMATEAGLMKDGALVDIKQEVVEIDDESGAGGGKRPLSETSQDGGGASSPTFGSPCVCCCCDL